MRESTQREGVGTGEKNEEVTTVPGRRTLTKFLCALSLNLQTTPSVSLLKENTGLEWMQRKREVGELAH